MLITYYCYYYNFCYISCFNFVFKHFLHFFRLKTIDLFESCSMQLGDTHWYKIKDTDKLITMKKWRKMCTETFMTGSGSLPSTTKKEKNFNKLRNTKKLPKSTISSFDLGNLNGTYINFV